MSSLLDHQILFAALILVLLVIVGIALLVVRVLGLFRAAKAAQARVDVPIRAISSGLQTAEQRVGALQDHQGDLTATVERVGEQASELQQLLGIAGGALKVLRAPLKYIGK
jgi:hypothetical protein